MKKAIALLLTLIMVLSLAACGSHTTTEESSTITEQTEATTPVAEEIEQTEETTKNVEAETTTETTEETLATPAFDTSWAGDEYVMPIPEPPFTQFSVEKSESQEKIQYMIYADGDEIGALTQDDVLAYTETLIDAGFTCVEYETDFSEETYWYVAYTEDQTASVTFECHIQRGAIVIIVEQDVIK